MDTNTSPRIIGRYALHSEIASGGMASIHIGRLLGPVGFSRTVAIKKLHPQFAKDPEFVSMFLDEARLAGRIRHPNVVSTLDVVALEGELFLVMEYVQGDSLSRLIRTASMAESRIPPGIVLSIVSGVLLGLHAAHEARSERGEPLNMVHRDVSPHNVIVGVDGTARVLDFGIAKAVGRLGSTREGQFKGKLAYMAPEQLNGEDFGRRADIYSASVVLWEALVGRKLFKAETEWKLLKAICAGQGVQAPSAVDPSLPADLDAIVLKGLSLNPDDRFETAKQMAAELERVAKLASAREVGEWVEQTAADTLRDRSLQLAEVETGGAPLLDDGNQPNACADPVEQILRSSKAPEDGATRSDSTRPAQASTGSGPGVVPLTATTSIPPHHGSEHPSTSTIHEPPRRGTRWVAMLAVVAMLVLVAAFWFVRAFGDRSPSAAPPVASTPMVAPSAPPTSQSQPVVAVDSADTGLIDPTATPSTTKGKSSSGKIITKGPGPAPAKSTASPPAVTSDPCNPPYTIDPNGIRRPKPQCM